MGWATTRNTFAFDIPVGEVAALDARIHQLWPEVSDQIDGARIVRMPTDINAPDWYQLPLEDPVFYQNHFDTIGISRRTGHVIIRRLMM